MTMYEFTEVTEEEMEALEFAFNAHSGQKRKYTNEPYITHPISVADIVKTVSRDIDLIRAAYLHDVIEDTVVTEGSLRHSFGAGVTELVMQVTDVSTPRHGNRCVRKALDREHLSNACPNAQTLKLADLIHNTQSITKYDPAFAKIYLKEKEALLEVLTEGDSCLYEIATKSVKDSRKG